MNRAEPLLPRRVFLCAVSSVPFLSAVGCKKESPPPPPPPKPACADTSELAPEEVQMRGRLGYVDHTPFPDKPCTRCQQYTDPAGGAPCGGCKVVPGKIDPAGYCKLFVAKA